MSEVVFEFKSIKIQSEGDDTKIKTHKVLFHRTYGYFDI